MGKKFAALTATIGLATLAAVWLWPVVGQVFASVTLGGAVVWVAAAGWGLR